MTQISLIMPYHNNPGMLREHYRRLALLQREILDRIEVVICDDASDEWTPPPLDRLRVPVKIFRIVSPHIAWSHRCATNIAAHHAEGRFLLLTDIDHIVPERTWNFLLERVDTLRKDTAYTFERENLDGKPYKSHPDSWLFHRELWHNQIRGYDERLRGHYGQNFAFIERVRHYAPTVELPVPLIRVSREDIPDASERVLTRKTEHAKRSIAALRNSFKAAGTFLADTRRSAQYIQVFP